MSMRRLGVLALLCAMALGPGAAFAQTVAFKAPANAPAGITVQVLTDDADAIPEDVPAVAGGWEYQVVPKPGQWRNEPTFLINLPPRTPEHDGVSSDAMTLELSFSFKASQAGDRFDVPLALFSGVGVADRQRIASMRPYQQYEKILLAQALALHYMARLQDPHLPQVRFTTSIWFETLFAAIVSEHRPLRLSSGLLQTIAAVFDNDPASTSHFNGAEAQIRQSTWNDQADLDGLVDANSCAAATSLASYLETFNEQNPGDAAAVHIGDVDAVIASIKARAAACAAG